MSDLDDAEQLATAAAVLGVAGVLFVMSSSIGDASTAQMVAWTMDVIRTIAVPAFGMIIALFFIIKVESLIDAFIDG